MEGRSAAGTILPSFEWSALLIGKSLVRLTATLIPYDMDSSYDPSNLLELQVDPPLRVDAPDSGKERSWFGPNGQYIRELPCPSCRGRGYIPCPECGVERSRVDCSQCNGKGIKTCLQCLGECVIWEESYDERPWEKARSSCPIKVKEDDEIDGLEIKVKETKKSKRVYGRPSPEVIQKISRSLKSLNAKTGLFSKRMKMIHKDPVLRAQRIAAIKKARGSPASRKQTSEMLKAYFSNPENRLKRSMAMKGVKFYCSKCGEKGIEVTTAQQAKLLVRWASAVQCVGRRGITVAPAEAEDRRRRANVEAGCGAANCAVKVVIIGRHAHSRLNWKEAT
ncbi:hypothetical protein HPP92_007641 [Vanilla planifolia]|uniref:Uncharacterized protein n=1 Tax=Vanilla planifolia TaxID=51239 RepID=A0A835V9L7_VANPL|nr:hypothetical protein HPP92_007641 [Vanilla planifolia]